MNSKKEVLDPQIVAQIKEARENSKLTQADVAKQARLTETFYAMTERGETNPSIAKLNRILKVLNLKILVKKV